MKAPIRLLFVLFCLTGTVALAQSTDGTAFGGPQNSFAWTQGPGAKAMGMGGAFTAVADDGRAYWNPAGLARFSDPYVTFGLEYVRTNGRYAQSQELSSPYWADEASVSAEYSSRMTNFQDLAVVMPFRIGGYPFAVGFGYNRVSGFPPFTLTRHIEGSTTIGVPDPNVPYTWEEDHVLPAETGGSISVYSFTFAVRPAKWLSVGTSGNYWRSDCDYRATGTFTMSDSLDYRYSGTYFGSENVAFHGWNVDFGALFEPTDYLSLGVVYKSSFGTDMDDFNQYGPNTTVTVDPTGATSTATSQTWEVNYNGRLTWPQTLCFGAAVKPLKNLLISSDLQWTGWSKATVQSEVWEPHEWSFPDTWVWQQSDTWAFKLGGEYTLKLDGGWEIPLRGGLISEQMPDNYFDHDETRFGRPTSQSLTVGGGVKKGPFCFDVAYVHRSGRDDGALLVTDDTYGLTQEFVGEHKVTMHRLVMSFSMKF